MQKAIFARVKRGSPVSAVTFQAMKKLEEVLEAKQVLLSTTEDAKLRSTAELTALRNNLVEVSSVVSKLQSEREDTLKNNEIQYQQARMKVW